MVDQDWMQIDTVTLSGRSLVANISRARKPFKSVLSIVLLLTLQWVDSKF